jgi:hypothetical protein
MGSAPERADAGPPSDRLSKWGDDLRQSDRTLGQAAGLSEIDMHLLMNHRLPGVNAGYIISAGTTPRKDDKPRERVWPKLASRRIGDEAGSSHWQAVRPAQANVGKPPASGGSRLTREHAGGPVDFHPFRRSSVQCVAVRLGRWAPGAGAPPTGRPLTARPIPLTCRPDHVRKSRIF